jgi:hypothetical protein
MSALIRMSASIHAKPISVEYRSLVCNMAFGYISGMVVLTFVTVEHVR